MALDEAKLEKLITAYTADLPQYWDEEKYKWEAVQYFQDHWDIDAPDFAAMLTDVLQKSRTYNLLDNNYSHSGPQMIKLAQYVPEQVKNMFQNLYDFKQPLEKRITDFQTTFSNLYEKYKQNANWKDNYQNTNAISTYLWLYNPDEYYIYKYEEYNNARKILKSNLKIPHSNTAADLLNCYSFAKDVCTQLQKNETLRACLYTLSSEDCYTDQMFPTLTYDFFFYLAHNYWWPSLDEYNPGLTIDDWLALLKNPNIFTVNALTALKRLRDYGGSATCTQLAEKYGETKNFYNKNLSLAAEYVANEKKLSRPFESLEDSKNARWWPILFVGKAANKLTAGSYIWKLRPELAAALEQIELSPYPLYANKELPTIWKISHGEKLFTEEELRLFAEQKVIVVASDTAAMVGSKIAQGDNFMFTMKQGDYFYLCYSGSIQLFGRLISNEVSPCIEKGDHWYQRSYELIAISKNTNKYKDKQKWWTPNFNSTCIAISENELSLFEELILQPYFDLLLSDLLPNISIPEQTNTESIPKPPVPYNRSNFLNEVYLSEPDLDTLLLLLKRKKNIILQGAPGVGKTFAAKRLAYTMMGEIDESRIKVIQFHQNYSYEDFIMGYKPTEDGGFKLKEGVFYQFCKKAAKDETKRPYFFIIDEINRGNLSKIFGELLMLIEADKRGEKYSAELAYKRDREHESFSVPDNLYIIGMMNTADRSLAIMDYALRRRFSFFDMKPAFENEQFKDYLDEFNNDTFKDLIKAVQDLNQKIKEDDALGEGFCIGHSYFCTDLQSNDIIPWLQQIVQYDIIPTLKEYWFDNKEKVEQWEKKLNDIVKSQGTKPADAEEISDGQR